MIVCTGWKHMHCCLFDHPWLCYNRGAITLFTIPVYNIRVYNKLLLTFYRASDSGNDSTKNRKQSPQRKMRQSRSKSPVPRQHYDNNYERNDRKMYSPNKNNKDLRSGWRDRRNYSRPYGKHHNYEYGVVNQDRPVDGGNDRWEEPTISNSSILTLEVLENRLKEDRAIFSTPDINPCYSLDEFNYPAPPQWYLKAVTMYNKRLGHSGIGDVAWRDGSNSDGYVSDNVGYQYAPPLSVRPTPLFDRDEPITVPSFDMSTATILRPPMNNAGPFLNNLGPSAGPPVNLGLLNYNTLPVNVGPIAMPPVNIRPPNFNNIGPFPINALPVVPLVNTHHPETNTGPSQNTVIPTGPTMVLPINAIMPGQLTNMATPISTVLQPALNQVPVEERKKPNDATTTEPESLFEPEMFESFPKVGSPSGDGLLNKTAEVDLLIIANEDDNNNGKITFDNVSRSPSPLFKDDIKPSLSVSTVCTQSFGKKGRQNGRGRTNRRASGGTRRSPKCLIVSIDLIKVKPRPEENIEAVTDEEFNYDDYLDQLNDEEEEKPGVLGSRFWIDKNPESRSRKNFDSTEQTVNNPLDDDFPAVDEDASNNLTLRSLVGDSHTNKSVITEEGKV